MSNTTNTAPSTTIEPAGTGSPTGRGNAPTHAVFHVRDGVRGGKAFWTRIGSAWGHADAKGFNVQVECMPLDGRLSLRIIDESRE